MSWIGNIGESALRRLRFSRDITAVVWTVLCLAVRPSSWVRTVRALFAKQILFTGVDALGLILLIGLLAGVSVVAQTQYWLNSLGQSAMLGQILVVVIIREAGPLLVNFVVIGRSGTAMATELASMRVRGEIAVLEAQGIDPLRYLVLPRVLGMGLSIFCLTVFLVGVSLASGFVVGVLLGVTPNDVSQFTNSIMGAAAPADIVNLLVKTLVPGFLAGAISCREGLYISGSVTDVPRAATNAVVRSILAVLIVSAIASVLTYL